MKNNITDLRNHLFAQLERLGDEDLTPEKLETEIKRSQAMVEVSNSIIESAKTEVLFAKVTGENVKTSFLKSEVKQLS